MTSHTLSIALVLLLAACSGAPAPEAAPAASTVPVATAPAADAAPQAAVTDAQDVSWLLGTWELTYDPDNSPKDQMVFSPGGGLQIQDAEGKTAYEGNWVLEGSKLALSVQLGGRTVTLNAEASPERDRLTNESGAYYTRRP